MNIPDPNNLSDETDIERLIQRGHGLQRLIHASIRINAERTLKGVLQAIADSAREVIGCKYAALAIVGPSGDTVENFVFSGMDNETRNKIGTLPVGKGVLSLLADDPTPTRLSNLASHPRSSGFPKHHPPMHSFLGVPVLGKSAPVGNLYFTEKIGADAFSDQDESIAVMFAANAAVAVQNARLDEESIRLLNELQLMHQSRDRFYAMVNHELRNALTAVHGWSELLLRKSGGNPSQVVKETMEAAQYALELMNDLLDLSRLDASMIKLRTADVLATDLAQGAIATVQPSAEERQVLIRLDAASDTACHTDGRRVRQILVNLLSNAIRHSRDNSEVVITIDMDADKITFRVIDKGEGIGPEETAIIFDAYKRADSKAGGGTGLGLTLSRRLAQMLGGDLSVESVHGKGATFTLIIDRYFS